MSCQPVSPWYVNCPTASMLCFPHALIVSTGRSLHLCRRIWLLWPNLDCGQEVPERGLYQVDDSEDQPHLHDGYRYGPVFLRI